MRSVGEKSTVRTAVLFLSSRNKHSIPLPDGFSSPFVFSESM
jgi:hypothetical protein